jgi:hypothetical protein
LKVEREKRDGPGKDPLPKGESHQNNLSRKEEKERGQRWFGPRDSASGPSRKLR